MIIQSSDVRNKYIYQVPASGKTGNTEPFSPEAA